jgi:hypothetical protein
MTMNKDTRKSRQKLTLKKQTIRDLTTKRTTADAVRAGAANQTEKYTCLCQSGLPTRC